MLCAKRKVKDTVQGNGAAGSSELGVGSAFAPAAGVPGAPGAAHLQCTVMGWLPVCCCCFCTAAMRSIMPLPSAGIPISGQPWKWNCRTTRVCSSWRARGCRAGRAPQCCPTAGPPALPGTRATVSGGQQSSQLAGLPVRVFVGHGHPQAEGQQCLLLGGDQDTQRMHPRVPRAHQTPLWDPWQLCLS